MSRFLAPPAAFAAAFARSFRRVPPADAVSAETLHALQKRNSALQAENARLQAALPQAVPFDALQAVVDSVPDGVLVYHHAGHLTPNPAALALLGIADSRAAPHFPPDVLRYPSGQSVPPGAFPWVRAALTRTATAWTPFLAAQDAHDLCPVEITARPTAEGAVAIVRDVSAGQNAAAWETQTRERQHALAEAARHLSRASDFQTLCQITTEAALALLPPNVRPSAHALLCTFDGQGQPMVLRAASPEGGKKRPRRHADTLPPQFEFDAQSPLLWDVYLDRQIVSSADVDADARFALSRERALLHSPRDTPPAIRSVLMLPLLPGAAASGHLLVSSPLADAFGPDTQDALALLATLSASALARAHSDALRGRQDSQFALLHQAALAACAGPQGDAFAETLSRCAADALGAAVCTLSLLDAANGSPPNAGDSPLRLWGTPPPELALPLPDHGSGSALCSCVRTTHRAVRRGLPVAQIGIPNPAVGECPWLMFGGQSGTHSALSLPLHCGGTVCGALTVFRHGSRPFSPQDISLAETFAALASLAPARADCAA